MKLPFENLRQMFIDHPANDSDIPALQMILSSKREDIDEEKALEKYK